MQAVAAILGPLMGGLGGFLGGRSANQAAEAERARLAQLIQQMAQGEQWSRGQMQGWLDPALQALLQGINNSGNVSGQSDNVFGRIFNTPGYLQQILQDNQRWDPDLQDAVQNQNLAQGDRNSQMAS